MRNTTLCYITRGNEVLMLHRVKKKVDVNKDKWIGIGGKFEENESPEDCLFREVKEETGLTLTDWRYCGIVTFVSDRWEGEYMHLFHATAFDGTLLDCDEGDLEWVPKSEFSRLPQWEGDRIFLRLMEDKVPFFSLKLCYKDNNLISVSLNGRPYDRPSHP